MKSINPTISSFWTFLLESTFFSWSQRLWPKKLHASVAVPAAPVRVPNQRPLAPSVASVTSVANNKGDNEMVLGAVHRSPGICLKAEECPRKPQLGDRLKKGDVRPVIASNVVPFLQMRSVGSHSTSGREKGGKKKRTGKAACLKPKIHEARII